MAHKNRTNRPASKSAGAAAGRAARKRKAGEAGKKPAKKTSPTGASAKAAKSASKPARPAGARRPAAKVASRRPAHAATALVERPLHADVGSKGRYVYCIIRTDHPLTFGPIGIGEEPAPVYTVRCDDLSAVVSDAPLGVLDPTRDNVLAHQRVNETVMSEHTVLPMSFGTVFKTRDDVTAFLKSAYRAFSDVLDKMENKLEFGLKVLWDRDAVIRAIEDEDEDINRLKNQIAAQKGSTYFARMQYGRLIDAALQDKSERYVSEIFERLRDVSVAARANKPIGDRMILNAAFLVSRDAELGFDARVKQLGASHDKLTFKYTGPWPPYNFVNIRLKLERA
jgi:Gas vesicle synthesis protein GvpL/GvpF